MIGILPFLVQWLALSHVGNRAYQSSYQQYSAPPKSHWALLAEFQELPEDEIEGFLPQVCNILIDRDMKDDYGVFEHFERILLEKCAKCLTFGMRVCGLLKASAPGPSEGLFRSVLSSNAAQGARDERLRNLEEHCEAATTHGHNLPERVSQLRANYYKDMTFVFDTLSRLSRELKSYPADQRNRHLRDAISQLNSHLYTRMITRGHGSGHTDMIMQGPPEVSPHVVAQECPSAAAYSLHLPLLHCNDKAFRLLQFVEVECEVLPSKDRCPYLVVAEMLEQSFICKSDELYTQGHQVGVTVEDIIHGRTLRHQPHFSAGSGSGAGARGQAHIISGTGATRGMLPGFEASDGTDSFDFEFEHFPETEYIDIDSVLNNDIGQVNANLGFGSHSSSSGSGTSSGSNSNSNSNGNSDYGSTSGDDIDSGIDSNGSTSGTDSSSASSSSASSGAGASSATATTGGDYSPSTSNVDMFAREEQFPGNVRDFARQETIARPINNARSYRPDASTSFPQNQYDLGGAGSSVGSNSNGNIDAYGSQQQWQQQQQQQYSQQGSGSGVWGQAHQSVFDKFRAGANPDYRPDAAYVSQPQPYDSNAGYSSNAGSYPGAPGGYSQQGQGQWLGPEQFQGQTPGQGPYGSGGYSYDNANSYQGYPQGPSQGYSNGYPQGQGGYGQGPDPGAYPYPGQPYPGDYSNQYGQNGMIPHGQGPSGPGAGGPGGPGAGAGAMVGSSISHMGMRKTFVKGKTWEEKRELVRSMSAFGHLPGWTCKSFIVKAGDDLRKELLAMQLIRYCQHIFTVEGVDITLKPYQIICTGQQAGLIEFLEGSRSIDRIKKSCLDIPTLREYFEFSFGAPYTIAHTKAVNNFVKSLAGYSLLTYLLQIRDRHNGNILLDNDGNVIHIDFGFILGDSPGFNMNFENAPFKLTREYLEVMGGVDSPAFKQFEDHFVRGFYALQKNVEGLSAIVQLFYGDRRKNAADGIKSRLMFAQSQADVLSLIRDSFDNWRTKQYDWFQQKSNNILM